VDAGYLEDCRNFLRRNLEAGVRTIERTREQVLKFLGEHHAMSNIQ
jgi:hypothetical protein